MGASSVREWAERARTGLEAVLAWAGPGARGDAFVETAHHLTIARRGGAPAPGQVRSGRGASLRAWSDGEVRGAAADGAPGAAVAACLRQLGIPARAAALPRGPAGGGGASSTAAWRGAGGGAEVVAGPPAAGHLLETLERGLANRLPAVSWELILHVAHRDTLVITEAGRPRAASWEWWRLRVVARGETGATAAWAGGGPGLGEIGKRWTAAALAPLLQRRLAGSAAEPAALPVCEAQTPVVFAAGNGALLLHELAHALEGDAVGRGWSPWADGGPLVSPRLTIWDDPSRPGLRGSYRHDDEGSPGDRVLLVRRGRVVGRLGDRLRAAVGAAARPGHGRRPSWREWPLPRAANLCLAAGDDEASTLAGHNGPVLWVHDLEAGAADPRSGDLSVVVSDGEWCDQGRVVAPVAGLTLAGNLVDLLERVDRVGNDRAADSGAAVCGREDAGVPIGLLAPSFRTAGLRPVGP